MQNTKYHQECKYAEKTDVDCQNNHYRVDLLGNSKFKPIPYSPWIKNNTQQKPLRQKMYRTDLLFLREKENTIENINLSNPQIPIQNTQ